MSKIFRGGKQKKHTSGQQVKLVRVKHLYSRRFILEGNEQ